MDILNQLRHAGGLGNLAEPGYDSPSTAKMASQMVPMTVTQLLDAQIKYHEGKIADLKSAKENVSPEVERALNALAKL